MLEPENIRQLSTLKPDLIGFIFFPGSPRYAASKLDPGVVKELPADITKTGVFVNAGYEEIVKTAGLFGLNAVQLHGAESPEMCRSLKAAGFKVIKVFHPKTQKDITACAAYEGLCDFFLFDTASKAHGGSGRKFDWILIGKYKGSTPFLLSGGIGPGDEEMISRLQLPLLTGIDLNSRFETAPGLKDIEHLRIFIEHIRKLTKTQV
jgi:phosphoribosylanthranilate isomerase